MNFIGKNCLENSYTVEVLLALCVNSHVSLSHIKRATPLQPLDVSEVCFCEIHYENLVKMSAGLLKS